MQQGDEYGIGDGLRRIKRYEPIKTLAGSERAVPYSKEHLRSVDGVAWEGTTVAARMIAPFALCARTQTLIGGCTFLAKSAMRLAACRHEAMAASQGSLCVCFVSHNDQSSI